MRGIEGDGDHAAWSQRRIGQDQPQQQDQQPHLGDARIGQHDLGVGLHHPDGQGEEHRQQPGPGQPGPPVGQGGHPERQEAQPTQDRDLDHGAAEHGARRDGGGRVCQR